MHKKDPSSSLKESIAKLEAQQAEEKRLLKEELSYAFEHLKPSNVIRNTVADLIATVHAKKNLLTTVMGAGAGYVASAIFGPKPTMLNRLGARFIQNAVTLAVTQNSQAITDVALNLVTTLRRKVESHKGPSLAAEDLLRRC
jgi:hypothetical protein